MLRLYLTLLAICGAADSYRLLAIYLFPGKSHHFVHRPVLEELGKRGHEVVYVTSFPYKTLPPNITQIDLSETMGDILDTKNEDIFDFEKASVPLNVVMLSLIGLHMGQLMFEDSRIQELIQSDEHFDAVLFESYFAQEYLSAFMHKFGAVGIETMPHGDNGWVNELSGLPDNTAYQLDFKNEYSPDMDFIGRLYNGYVTTTLTLIGYFNLLMMEYMAQKHFNYKGSENRPWLWHMVSNRSLILSNHHFALGYPAPLAPHHKHIGGINVRQVPGELPKDIQEFMDNSPDGVIYMSLGSIISMTTVIETNSTFGEKFIEVFSTLKQRVLMKWESEYSGELPKNIKFGKWFPQQAILAHKNIRLFITHGGILSLNEAVHYGVPVVGIPFFADQHKNLRQVENAGFGLMMRHGNLTRDSISWAVNEILDNRRYKEEAVRRSAMFRDRRLSPLDEAVYWVEFAIRHPNALTPKAAFLSFFVLHQFDTWLTCLVFCLVLGALIYKTCSLCRCRKSNGKNTSLSKKKKVKKQ